ncbi:MAG: ATP-binding cassette domain-containing protein [Thermogemmatispora sp.]|uniref:ATP-binding cassette domain-containing protein n=1 Tax=Thermogemmatispora sp. TaxID=1968838 RepID=UPI0019F30F02|nr:ATP-binding cassette domain-containing protein [Thermogemmatispora sp.]MBE3564507.1 ATP-binding cassette domain-containing protein [Thermogemmatispora sp.]
MLLEICRLEKTLEGRTVLSIPHLQIGAGEIVTLVGPSGCGKTLLLRMLAGQLKPSGGNIILDGRDLSRDRQARTRVALLFAEDLLYERLNPRQFLAFFCTLHALPSRRIDEVLTAVGLGDQVRQPISKLSLSARRRLSFAHLQLLQPALALLDEPVERVDWDTAQLFAHLIQNLAAQGSAVLIGVRDLAWAGKFCTRVIELEAGRISGDYSYAARSGGSESKEGEEGTAAPTRYVPYKVTARREDRIMLYDPAEVLYATSRDGRTILRTVAGEEATTNLTLQELEQRLSGRGFFKAHRAYLVNLQHIKAVIQFTRNSYTLQLDDPQETMIPLSKQSEKELQNLLDY